MKLHKWLLIPLIALLFCIPTFSAQAQDDNPTPPRYDEMDDEFIDALVMASVNHNLLAGKNELGELNALNEIVAEYYNSKLNSAFINWDEREKLTEMRDNHLSKIGKKIITVKRGAAKTWLITIFDFFTDPDSMKPWDPDPYVDENETDPRRLYAKDDNLPDSIERLENAILWTDFEKTVNAFLNVATISAIPSLGPKINDSSGWSYNLPGISDSAGVIPSIYNSTNSPSEDDSSPSLGDSAPPVSPPEDNSDAQDEPRLKPIRFDNNGFEPVTVVVESYEPAPGLSSYVPDASTVVNPESNSSAYLNLPLGTYTFCYYWQLDEDYNNDDYFDYHHRTTGTYTLNINSSTNVQAATTVTLSPDSNVSNPNGKCSEVAAQDNGDLTPEEIANQGTHTYSSVCYGNEWCWDEVDYLSITNVFSNGTVSIANEGEVEVFPRVGLNTYHAPHDEDWGVFIYVYSMTGFEITSTKVPGKLVYTLQD